MPAPGVGGTGTGHPASTTVATPDRPRPAGAGGHRGHRGRWGAPGAPGAPGGTGGHWGGRGGYPRPAAAWGAPGALGGTWGPVGGGVNRCRPPVIQRSYRALQGVAVTARKNTAHDPTVNRRAPPVTTGTTPCGGACGPCLT